MLTSGTNWALLLPSVWLWCKGRIGIRIISQDKLPAQLLVLCVERMGEKPFLVQEKFIINYISSQALIFTVALYSCQNSKDLNRLWSPSTVLRSVMGSPLEERSPPWALAGLVQSGPPLLSCFPAFDKDSRECKAIAGCSSEGLCTHSQALMLLEALLRLMLSPDHICALLWGRKCSCMADLPELCLNVGGKLFTAKVRDSLGKRRRNLHFPGSTLPSGGGASREWGVTLLNNPFWQLWGTSYSASPQLF